MAMKEQHGSLMGFYVDVSGTQTLVAARRGFEWTESTETVETSSADNSMWKTFIAGLQEGEITIDHIVLLDDQTGSPEASHKAIKDAKRNGEEITVQKRYPGSNGRAEEVQVIVTELSEQMPHDDVATVSATLKMAGAPQEITV